MTIDAKKVKVGDIFELSPEIRLVAVSARAYKLDINMCRHCVHGDGEGGCLGKQKFSDGSFSCNDNENFEEAED